LLQLTPYLITFFSWRAGWEASDEVFFCGGRRRGRPLFGSTDSRQRHNAGHATQALGTYQFSVSNAFGSGNFGTVTVSTFSGTTVDISVSVAPNFLLNSGTHEVLTFSLVAGGTVDTSSITSNGTGPASQFSVAGPATTSNPPFGDFTWQITSSNTNGNDGPVIGSTLDFHVLNFAGLVSATNQFNNNDIFFAADISEANCETGCTGVVGATFLSAGGHQNGDTPLPAAVWLMGTILGGGAGVGAWRRRKQRAKVA
jgi:hypothetical protein